MKEKIINVLSVFIVLVSLIFSILVFNEKIDLTKWKDSQKETESYAENNLKEKNTDEAAKQLAEILQVHAELVAPTGKEIRAKEVIYTVDEWEITKQCPKYPVPIGMDIEQHYSNRIGLELDSERNIVDDRFYYVIVNLRVKNIGDENHKFWSTGVRLKGVRENKYWYSIGEWEYVAEEVAVEYEKNYGIKRIEPNEEKELHFIFIAEKTLVDDKQLYIDINPYGTSTINSEEYASRRWILLN